eukprot:TRINITY_DN6411_c0_g1_i2.p1 TRINITY_DN6411_c0_g1~~TRINITY_DN6411_c0_g1_i2.p1  ORF type:complete len:346 (+),score=106.30 TRINITY_DN6411_c0_g1_i2:312-1349(+)
MGEEWLDEDDVKLEGLDAGAEAAGGGAAEAAVPPPRVNPLVKRLPNGAAGAATAPNGDVEEVIGTLEGLAGMGLTGAATVKEVMAVMKQIATLGGEAKEAAEDTPAGRVVKSVELLQSLGMGSDAALSDAVAMLRNIAGAGGARAAPNAAPATAPTPPARRSSSPGVQRLKHVAAAGAEHADVAPTPHYPYRPQTPTQPPENEYNRRLEEAIQEHFKGWVGSVRDRARRAIEWVLSSMLEEAKKGKVHLAYDIPPGQEDFLHETFPEWMTEERGIELLRCVVLEELRERGMKVPTDALEKRTHGENRDRHYFRLSYTVPAPGDVPSAHTGGSPMFSMTSSLANGR